MTDLVRLDDNAADRAPVRELQRWDAHPKWAMVLRVALAAFPALVGFVVMRVALAALPPSEAPVPALAWFAAVAVVGVGVAMLAERLARRFLPLVAFLRLSMAFPDQAPSRFAVAMRTSTTRQLERRIKEIREVGLTDVTEAHFGAMVLELAAALSVHDRLTRGHGERVRAYTDLIAEEMGLDEDDMEKLRWASLLHDVGKLLVPREILNKPGRLTNEEFDIIKQHPLHGMRLVVPLRDWLGPWVHAVSQHHERWDGGGYPFGLSGTNIHLGARIVAVADAFDVMTSARSYKAPMKVSEARAELARCAGSQFDPAVVRAFLSVGLGRMHQLSGPLGILLNLGSLSGAPILPQAAPVMSSLVAASTMTVVGLPPALNDQRADEPPPALAFADDVDLDGAIVIDGVTVSSGVGAGLRFGSTTPGDGGADATSATPTASTAGGSSSTVPGGSATGGTSGSGSSGGVPTTVPRTGAADSPGSTTTTTAPGSSSGSGSPTAPPGTTPPAATNLPLTGSLVVSEDGDGVWRASGTGSVPSLTVVAEPRHGQISITSGLAAVDGEAALAGSLGAQAARWSAAVTYRPEANFTGSDTVELRSCRSGSCVQTSLSISVTAVNDLPSVAPRALSRSVCDRLTVEDLMAGVSDVDGDGVSFVAAVRSNGQPVDLANLGTIGVGPEPITVTVVDSGGAQASGVVTVTTTAPAVSWGEMSWNTPGPTVPSCGSAITQVTWRIDGATVGTSTGSVHELFEAVDNWPDFLIRAFGWGSHTVTAVIQFADGSTVEQSTTYTIEIPTFGAGTGGSSNSGSGSGSGYGGSGNSGNGNGGGGGDGSNGVGNGQVDDG